jgi:thiamine pyrophosphate-dependent acetolactate synthase large subunit-like protein
VSLAKGYEAKAHHAERVDEIRAYFEAALGDAGVTVIEIPIGKHIKALLHD